MKNGMKLAITAVCLAFVVVILGIANANCATTNHSSLPAIASDVGLNISFNDMESTFALEYNVGNTQDGGAIIVKNVAVTDINNLNTIAACKATECPNQYNNQGLLPIAVNSIANTNIEIVAGEEILI